MRVAVDAMGGDHAPGAIVRGAVQARSSEGGAMADEVVLVGDRQAIEAEMASCPGDRTGIAIEHASQTVAMDESPVRALRDKPDSSISVAVRMMAAGRVGAVVSAGNTGAVVAATIVLSGLLHGIKRPGIAVILPHAAGQTVIIDAGANVKCKPYHLYQYGVMGTIYAQTALNLATPRVGLLTVGEEDAKGNDLVKGAHRLLKVSGLAFVGNIEGCDIHSGICDVVVCDGFTGNVVLKLVEAMGKNLLEGIQRELTALDAEGARQVKAAVGRVMARHDPSTYGGAPLLGINGICIICHGRSSERAIVNAIRLATTFNAGNVNNRIVEDLEARGVHRWSGIVSERGKGSD